MPAPREPHTVSRQALTEGQLRERRWAANGAALGLIAGALVAVVYIGERIREWSFAHSALLVAGTAIGGMVIGYFSLWIAAGSTGGASPIGGGDGDGGGGDGGDSGSSE